MKIATDMNALRILVAAFWGGQLARDDERFLTDGIAIIDGDVAEIDPGAGLYAPNARKLRETGQAAATWAMLTGAARTPIDEWFIDDDNGHWQCLGGTFDLERVAMLCAIAPVDACAIVETVAVNNHAPGYAMLGMIGTVPVWALMGILIQEPPSIAPKAADWQEPRKSAPDSAGKEKA